MRDSRASMQEVAKVAGVSAMTVSRALRDPGLVSAATLKRIEDAVKQIGYVQDYIAGGLKSARTRVVGCVVPSIAIPVFADLIQGLTDRMAEEDHRLIIASHGYDQDVESALVSTLLGYRPQGFVLTGVTHHPGVREKLRVLDVPVVEVWEETQKPIDMVVGFSNRAAVFDLVSALAERGRRRIVFIGTTDRQNSRARSRRQGHKQAIRRHGLPLFSLTAEATARGARKAFADFIAFEALPDAVVCVNDMMAFGVLSEAHKRGISVPANLAVAGFGDFDIAAETTPPLTTIRIPRYQIGVLAASMIMKRAKGEKVERTNVDVGFEIVWRESA